MLKASRLGVAAVALGALALTACSTGTTGGDDTSSDGPSFVYITPEALGINEFLKLGDAGTKAAAEELGGTAKTFESDGTEQSMRSNIEAALDEAPDAIVLTTFQLTAFALEYATDNPEQPFVLIDDCPVVEGDLPSNLYCAQFAEYEGAYLAGVEAGHLTETGSVASVGALDTPFINRYTDSFALGAQSVDAAITDSQGFVGGDNPFADPVGAKEVALAALEGGADQVFAATAGGNGGVFEAAQEQSAFSYGVDINQCGQAEGVVVDNVIKKIDVVVLDQLTAIMDGEAGGSSTIYDLASGGLSLTGLEDGVEESGCVIAEHPEVIAAVEAARDAIIAGDVVVPDPITAG